MDWSERRQLLYLGCLLLFLGGIAAAVINRATTTVPTCYDGKKNGGETGVDCGGACTFYCRDELSQPTVRWVRMFEITPGIVHAVAYIEHGNPAAAARSALYEFRIYDEKNNPIASRTGTTFIGPFGRSAIVETLIPVGNNVPASARFLFTGPVPWERISPAFSQVVIKSDRQLLEPFSGGTRLTATLQNQSRYAFARMEVVAILYDAADNAIAVSKQALDSLGAEQQQVLYFTWPDKTLATRAVRVEVIPRFNPFAAQES